MTNKSFLISVSIFVSTMILVCLIGKRGEPVVLKTNIENLPVEIAGFEATEDIFPDEISKELDTDKYLYRHYQSPDGRNVDLYIGYYGTAKGGRTGHNPYACLAGAGWKIVDSHSIKLDVAYKPKVVEINYILSRKAEKYEVLLYWYQSQRVKVLSSGIQQNLQRFLDRIFHNRNDGAFVQISALADENKIEEISLLIKFFAGRILETLPEYWPVEGEPLSIVSSSVFHKINGLQHDSKLFSDRHTFCWPTKG
jgi:EpsI family protein